MEETKDTYDIAEQIVIALMDDLDGRKGVGFEMCDEETKQEAVSTWLTKVENILRTVTIIIPRSERMRRASAERHSSASLLLQPTNPTERR